METNNKNENSCPLHNQSGRDGIKDFDDILAHLPPEQRRAFERERTERLADLWAIYSGPNVKHNFETRYPYGCLPSPSQNT